MKSDKYPKNLHAAYHAHVYFDESSKQQAWALCETIKSHFNLKVGRFHERPIGPHPVGSCQVSFDSSDFDEFVIWLEINRNGLTILIHGLTGDDLKDHTEFAYWLGEPLMLDISLFSGR